MWLARKLIWIFVRLKTDSRLQRFVGRLYIRALWQPAMLKTKIILPVLKISGWFIFDIFLLWILSALYFWGR